MTPDYRHHRKAMPIRFAEIDSIYRALVRSMRYRSLRRKDRSI